MGLPFRGRLLLMRPFLYFITPPLGWPLIRPNSACYLLLKTKAQRIGFQYQATYCQVPGRTLTEVLSGLRSTRSSVVSGKSNPRSELGLPYLQQGDGVLASTELCYM